MVGTTFVLEITHASFMLDPARFKAVLAAAAVAVLDAIQSALHACICRTMRI